MSLKKNRFFKRVTVRLTLWYLILFSLLLTAVFLTVQYTLTSTLKKQMDQFIHTKMEQLEWMDGIFDDEYVEKVKGKATKNLHWQVELEKDYQIFLAILNPEYELIVSALENLKHDEILKSEQMPSWIVNSNCPDTHEAVKKYEGPVVYEVEDSLLTAYQTFNGGHGVTPVRVGYRRFKDGNLMIIGASLHNDARLLEEYRKLFGGVFGVMLLLGGFIGYFLTRRAMQGVERVTGTATHISKGDLNRRVPVGREGAEIEDLARAFNKMLERIQALIAEISEVSHNIAHDLRSPVTRMRGVAETTLNKPGCGDSCREMCGEIIEECDRLVTMINTMLDIAETDSGARTMKKESVDFNRLVQKAVELFHPVADDQQVNLAAEYPDESLYVSGDTPKLQRMVANIIDNAIKFTPPDGKILLKLSRDNGEARLNIEDTGIGIEPTDLPHIFERFYRGDKSRSTAGNGLGLSLARSIVLAHQGEIHVESTPGKGSCFMLQLPLELGKGMHNK